MSNIHLLNGKKVHLSSDPPLPGSDAPEFQLVNIDQQTVSQKDFIGSAIVLYSVPAIDSEKCFITNCQLNSIAKPVPDIPFIGISMDLPMTLKRIHRTESLNNVYLMSDYLDREFGIIYGVLMQDGILSGLLARSIFVLNSEHQIIYSAISERICHGFDEDEEELTGLKEALQFITEEC